MNAPKKRSQLTGETNFRRILEGSADFTQEIAARKEQEDGNAGHTKRLLGFIAVLIYESTESRGEST
jgi:hypothetical protein